MLEVETQLAEGDWPRIDWNARAREAVEAAIRATAHAHLVTGRMTCELAVRLSNDAEVKRLNSQYRGQDRATNVLSFPLVQRDLLPAMTNSDDGEVLLGDIILAAETCAREADEKGVSLTDHATHLIVHGALHIVGYEHEDDAEASEMERLETSVLAGLGVTNPYSDRDAA